MPSLSTQLNYEALSVEAAKLIVERIKQKPSLLLCLATGSTPTRTYEHLATRPKGLFNEIRILKLDEWGGIPMNSPATCETYLRRILIDPLDLSSRYTGFDSQPVDPSAECARIGRWLEQNGPIDLCVLGLGVNGHLGFNEPAAVLQPHAHIATLSFESIQHSMVQNLSNKPTFGLTLGVTDILNSREIILLVSGPTKADPFRQLVDDIGKGTVRPSFPASCLAKHDNTLIFCDQAAAEHFL